MEWCIYITFKKFAMCQNIRFTNIAYHTFRNIEPGDIWYLCITIGAVTACILFRIASSCPF